MFKRKLEKQYFEDNVIDEVWVRGEDGVLVKVEPEEEETSGTADAASPSAEGVSGCC